MTFPVVIVAGGVASRLQPYSSERPKSLMELEPGVAILDFILKRFTRANLNPVYLVTRREYITLFKQKLGNKAVILSVDAEEFGNLYTVHTAFKHVDPPFLVAMSDHVFEYGMLKKLLSHFSNKAFTICLDRKPSLSEVKEGLKVKLQGERVVEVGKSIESRYGIDTGLIIVRENARRYIEEVIAERGPNAAIGEALDRAAKDGEVDYVDVTGFLWKDIDTPSDLLYARKIYRQINLRDYGRKTASLATKILVRPLTGYLAGRLGRNNASRVILLSLYILAMFSLVSLLFLDALKTSHMYLAAYVYVLIFLTDFIDVLVSFQDLFPTYNVALISRVLAETSMLYFLVASLGEISANVVYLVAVLGATSSMLTIIYEREELKPAALTFLADPALKYFLALLLVMINQQILALAYWIASGLAVMFSAGTSIGAAKPTELTEEFPKIAERRSLAARKLERAGSKGFKLILALIVLSYVNSHFGRFTLLQTGLLSIDVSTAVSAITLLAIVYYGYYVLDGVRVLVDALAVKMTSVFGITESVAKHIGLDLLYLGVTLLALLYVPSLLRTLPAVGQMLELIVSLILLIFLVFFMYDLSRVIYKAFGEFFSEIIKRIEGALEHESR
ncbi:MAG: NTP transferase domain-containing protein [Thermofilum sp.]|nr:NTP transferase domain-containing protein [Thermofilum sp.]